MVSVNMIKKGAAIAAGVGFGMFLSYKIYQEYFGKKICPPADKFKNDVLIKEELIEEVITPIKRNGWHNGNFFTYDKILAQILMGKVEEDDSEEKMFVIDGELKKCYDLVGKVEKQLKDALQVESTTPEEIAQLNELYDIAKNMFSRRFCMLGKL